MKYMGSKARFAKELIKAMSNDMVKASSYVEPFAGGFNLITEVPHMQRYANDINRYVIALMRALQNNWLPPETVSKEQYEAAKNKELPDELIGYIGICCSYSGKWFGGYAGVTETKDGVRDYIAEARRNLLKQLTGLRGIYLCSADYTALTIPSNSLIYCDPPYKGTTGYGGDFDYKQFYNWCEKQVENGHIVYVSEYETPWQCVWEKQAKSSLSANGKVGGNKVSVERLFKVSL